MAKMLINGLVEFAGIDASEIIVTRKDESRLTEICELYKGIKVCKSLRDIAEGAKCIFVCVKPNDVKNVLDEIKPFISKDTHVISLAAAVKLINIQNLLHCKVSVLIPSAVSEIGEGISLFSHGPNVTEEDRRFIYGHIGKFSTIKTINDDDMGLASELTSCMPGFVAAIFDNMSRAALKHSSSFSASEISEMINLTVFAASKLMLEKEISYTDLITKVATKGGITREGVCVFDEMLPKVFESVFSKTLEKRSLIESSIDTEFK